MDGGGGLFYLSSTDRRIFGGPRACRATRSGCTLPRCPSRQAVQISYPRDGTIARIAEVGRRRWRKEAGAHRQARAENAMLRYKRTIGEALKARKMTTQATETRFAVSVLNRMTAHGAPVSVAVVR